MSPGFLMSIAPWQWAAGAGLCTMCASARMYRGMARMPAQRIPALAGGTLALAIGVTCFATSVVLAHNAAEEPSFEQLIAETHRDFDPIEVTGSIVSRAVESLAGPTSDGMSASTAPVADGEYGLPRVIAREGDTAKIDERLVAAPQDRATPSQEPPTTKNDTPDANRTVTAAPAILPPEPPSALPTMPTIVSCDDDPSIDGCYTHDQFRLGGFSCAKANVPVGLEYMRYGVRLKVGLKGRPSPSPSTAVVMAPDRPTALSAASWSMSWPADIAAISADGRIRIVARDRSPDAAPPDLSKARAALVMRAGEFTRLGIDDRCRFNNGEAGMSGAILPLSAVGLPPT